MIHLTFIVRFNLLTRWLGLSPIDGCQKRDKILLSRARISGFADFKNVRIYILSNFHLIKSSQLCKVIIYIFQKQSTNPVPVGITNTNWQNFEVSSSVYIVVFRLKETVLGWVTFAFSKNLKKTSNPILVSAGKVGKHNYYAESDRMKKTANNAENWLFFQRH